ncbi:50S ribosomal protein L6 [Luteimonas sp. YGD11-2]|uniref:50S ribosomal protein L6 n=1 Tax=Luteimonas sp. YGD11-2 TaxID=2508168 RepID=UPI00100B32C6|nr:50S ribosomal protein L6 [Luteimonas sp. YGD11-2]
MSRVAKKPVALPQGVELNIQADTVGVKGPKGTLSTTRPEGVEIKVEDGHAVLSPVDPSSHMAITGTLRAILANMVHGVSQGFERKLELVGVGYRATMQGKDLSLALGFSHPVVFQAPEGVSISTPTQTEILITGADKQAVGQAAAKIRGFRPPEPYKGKGVKYSDETVIRKEAKKA